MPVIFISLIPISGRIAAKEHELANLLAYPPERLAEIIHEIGFTCDRCSKCCTRSFNGHVFLLDEDTAAAREIDPESVEPAPFPEFCDQNGTFYVSGFALRTRNDKDGSCCFLEEGRCRIYERRFSICRVYPYMLHRERDARGETDWRQFSGLDEHGSYHAAIPEEECQKAAAETIRYETACISHEIAFLSHIRDFFAGNGLRHVQKIYDDRMRAYERGDEIRIRVFCSGTLEEFHIRKSERSGPSGK